MTKTVTISALRSDLTPYAHHDVIVTLVAGSAGGVIGSNVVVESSKVRLDANGAGSIVLSTNDVEITSPSTSFYRFTVEGSSPTITRSIRLTNALASTVSWTLADIQVGDPTTPDRDVSSDYVTVAGESLTNYLADLDTGGLELGETSTTAYRGDRGKTAYDHSQVTTGNPHSVTAADVGAAATSHTHAASTITSGTLDIARIPTGTTSTTVPLGNDSRFTDARTPTAHKSSHARGGSDVLGVGHFAPDLPGVLGTGVRVGPNVPLTRGMCVWVPIELLAIDVKVTSIWIKVGTGVASGAVTAGINAAKSATLDAPGTLLASTSAGAISTAATGVVGGSLTAAQTLTAGVRYFVQLILLGGASNPTVQSADGILGSGNWEKGATAPVTPTAGPDTMGAFVWSGRTGLESDPPRASYVSMNNKPFVYLSLEAP